MFDLYTVSSMTTRSDRLRRARIDAGFETAKDAARHFGWNENTYSSNESGYAPFSMKSAKKYGAAFQVNPNWLYDGTHESDTVGAQRKNTDAIVKNGDFANGAVQLPQISHSVPVYGYVEAGAWREMSDIDEVIEIVPFHAPEYAHLKLSGWRVSGLSMNKFYPPESSVIGASPHDIPLRKGSFVVVTRTRADTAEITLKQFDVTDTGHWQFWPRSTDPRYQIPLSPPPRDELAQEGWEILSIILGESKRVPQTGEIVEFDAMPRKMEGTS